MYRYLTRFHGDCQMNLNSVERIIEYCEVPSERYGDVEEDKRVSKSGGLGLGIGKKRLNRERVERGELYSLLPHTTGEEDGEEEDGSDTENDGDKVDERKEDVSYIYTSPVTTIHSPLNPQLGDTSARDDVAIDFDITAALRTHTDNDRGEGAIEFRQVQLKYRISDPPVLRFV